MGYMDRLRADWLSTRDADDYFEQLQEQRDDYGPAAAGERGETMRGETMRDEITLQQIDRICCRHLQGELTAAQAIELVTVAIGKWTDPPAADDGRDNGAPFVDDRDTGDREADPEPAPAAAGGCVIREGADCAWYCATHDQRMGGSVGLPPATCPLGDDPRSWSRGDR